MNPPGEGTRPATPAPGANSPVGRVPSPGADFDDIDPTKLGPIPADVPSIVYEPACWMSRLDFTDLFPEALPVEVEIGCGDGSFLAKYAAIRRDRNFLGVERLLGRLRKLDKKARRQSLNNIRIMRIEALYFTRYLLPLEQVEAVHLYFPDPWPKARHAKNRMVQPAWLDGLQQTLVPGGVVYLRTDNVKYFEQMLEVFGEDRRFIPVETPDELKAVTTDFERDFNAQGIPTNYAAYRKA